MTTTLLVFNDNFLSERHVCYYTIDNGSEISLFEVVERKYAHPQAPDDAVVPVVEIKRIGSERRNSPMAACWVLLEAAQRAVKMEC